MLIALILLVALAYYDVPDLVDKFSFALTLSSLLLAILAIFYTIISAQKQDMQLTKLVETNSSLGNAADEIRLAAKDIRLFAQEAPQHFQVIGHKLDGISANYETLKSSQVPQPKTKEISAKSPPEIDVGKFTWFFGHLQFSAMAVFYLFERSQQKGKNIEPDVFEKLGISSSDYAFGVLTALEASGLISFKFYKLDIIPMSCSEIVTQGINDLLIRIADVVEVKNAERLRRLMAAIEAHVANPGVVSDAAKDAAPHTP